MRALQSMPALTQQRPVLGSVVARCFQEVRDSGSRFQSYIGKEPESTRYVG